MKKVPWAYKHWPQMSEETKDQIRQHVRMLQREKGMQHAYDYVKYLRNWCDMPMKEFRQVEEQ